MKYSRQREMVYEVAATHLVHPTADYIYSLLRQQDPKISLGTVYRNLNQLFESGKLRKISMPGASDRFDARLDEHQHMVCEKCGKVFDVEIAGLKSLDHEVLEQTGFHVDHYELVIQGVCEDCVD